MPTMEFYKIKSPVYLGLFWVFPTSLNLGVKAQALTNPDTLRDILTPEPSPKPKINGAKVYGIMPNSPLIYRIAATGNRPMTFSASNLPKGISLDRETGILTGKVTENGTYKKPFRPKKP